MSADDIIASPTGGWFDTTIHGAATSFFLAGAAAIALVGLVSGSEFPGTSHVAPWISQGLSSVVVVAALLGSVGHRTHPWFAVIGASFALAGLVSLTSFFEDPWQSTNWVVTAEAFTLAWASFQTITGRQHLAGLLIPSLMLVIFGTVHLIERVAVGSLVPSWVPASQYVPIATGLVMILLGLAILARIELRSTFVAVAAMFASWIPLIHAGRLLSDPGSAFEWAFAAMCVALTGSMLVGARAAGGAARNCSQIKTTE